MNEQRETKGKLDFTYMPLGALEAHAVAGAIGEKKYGRDNYREHGGYSIMTCLRSALRHLFFRLSGERFDKDATQRAGFNVDHLWLAAWNLNTACEILRLYPENDDTFKREGQIPHLLDEKEVGAKKNSRVFIFLTDPSIR